MTTSSDLSTDEGVLEHASYLMHQLSAVFTTNGTLPMGIVCIANRFEGQRFACPTSVTIIDDGSDLGKDALSNTFHYAARECQSTGVFFFSETWSLDFVSEDEFERWKDRDFSEHPRAYETLYLSLEHRTLGCRAWEARITRDELSGHATVGDFEPKLDRFEGRFAGFLEYLAEGAS